MLRKLSDVRRKFAGLEKKCGAQYEIEKRAESSFPSEWAKKHEDLRKFCTESQLMMKAVEENCTIMRGTIEKGEDVFESFKTDFPLTPFMLMLTTKTIDPIVKVGRIIWSRVLTSFLELENIHLNMLKLLHDLSDREVDLE